MGQPVLHFEIVSQDNDQQMAFYTDLFGWKIDADNPFNYGMIDAGDNGGGIGGGMGGAMGDTPPYITVYVEVEDVEATLTKAESLGATRRMGPDEIMPGLTIGIFSDTEDRMMGVMHNDDQA